VNRERIGSESGANRVAIESQSSTNRERITAWSRANQEGIKDESRAKREIIESESPPDRERIKNELRANQERREKESRATHDRIESESRANGERERFEKEWEAPRANRARMEEPLDSFKKDFRADIQNEYRSHFFADNNRMGFGGVGEKVETRIGKSVLERVAAKEPARGPKENKSWFWSHAESPKQNEQNREQRDTQRGTIGLAANRKAMHNANMETFCAHDFRGSSSASDNHEG
jgi:hypothetical protein